MAANLLDLAVPGLGSALTLLRDLKAKFDRLKEGKELCASLHDRLAQFAQELCSFEPETLKAEALLERLVSLIVEFSASVTAFDTERNFVKRVLGASKFFDQIKVFNERLDSIIALITVNQTKKLVELLAWREQYDTDSATVTTQLTEMADLQAQIWAAMKELPTTSDLERMVLLLKRDYVAAGTGSGGAAAATPPQPLDPVRRNIVAIAEASFLDGVVVPNPPEWLIDGDEVVTHGKPIDDEGFTSIYAGEWQGAKVAVKKFAVLDENPVFDKHLHIWRKLLHPHVALLYGAGTHKGAPFFVYEYSSRQSLDRCWDQLTGKEVWRLLYQAALGLMHLHRKKIVHGNLSCAKLLVTEQGSVKLFGFGASHLRENNRSNSIRPEMREEFAAPECVGIGPSGRLVGHRRGPRFESDVYSFGLTIMEAVAKKDPFLNESLNAIRKMKQASQLRRPIEMNDDEWALVRQMCVCDPSQRVSLAFVVEQLARHG